MTIIDPTRDPELPRVPKDLDRWAIVGDGGRLFIGKISMEDGASIALSPAFSYIVQIGADQRGLHAMRRVVPIDLVPSMAEIWIESRTIVRLAHLSKSDGEMFCELIQEAGRARDQIATSTGAKAAGIVLPNGGLQ